MQDVGVRRFLTPVYDILNKQDFCTNHMRLGRLASLMDTLGAAARPASAISSLKSPIESGNYKKRNM